MADLVQQWRQLAQILVGAPELSPLEVAQQSGVPIEEARRLWRALGLPPVPDDERVFSRSDVAVLQTAAALVQQGVTAPELLIQMTRVIGQAMTRIAEAQISATAKSPTASDQPVVILERIGLAAPALVPVFEKMLGYVWRRHLLAAAWRHAAVGELGPVGEREVVVGFADLVGFTSLSQQLDDHDLAQVIDRFETLVYDHIPEKGGRVIKMIGDEVMFAADDASAGANIALELVASHAGNEDLPDLRAGLAQGPVLALEGDLFGTTVNLASRLANLARPQTVLVSERLAEALEGNKAFRLRRLPFVHIKGIGRERAYVLRAR